MTISVMVNGKKTKLDGEITVRELLDHLEIASPALAVEINQKIIKKKDHDTVAVSDGDRIEIVTFVGGG